MTAHDAQANPPDRPANPVDWARLAPDVPAEWFLRPERAHGIHGAGHIGRVCVHVLRLSADLGLADGPRCLALTAALWHDIGRTHDGLEPEHGAAGVRRVRELELADERVRAGDLSPADVELVLFAVHHHSLDDDHGRRAAQRLEQGGAPVSRTDDARRGDAGPRRGDAALDLLWLLKDADALDRVRLGGRDGIDPRYLRLPQSAGLIDFAWELYALV